MPNFGKAIDMTLSGIEHGVRGVNTLGRGVNKVASVLQPGADAAVGAGLSGVSRLGRAIGRSSFEKSADGRVIGNLMTGYNMKPGAKWAWGAGIAAVGLTAGPMIGYHATHTYGVSKAAKQARMGQVVYSGGLPSLAYDAAPNINPMTGKYDLGATGDITLALSAQRSNLAKSMNGVL